MQRTMIETLQLQINQRKTMQRYRKRTVFSNSSMVNFSSNDYLDMAKHARSSKHLGSGSSALLTGYTSSHKQLEKRLAEFLGYEKGLLFGSGYLANLGVIHALLKEGGISFQDKLNHNSLIDSARYSPGKLQRFLHQDYHQLNDLLTHSTSQSNKIIISDGIFSMRGNSCDINQLVTLAKQHDALLMLDDAHGIGVMGSKGLGVCETLNADMNKPDILVFSLAKAFGCYGAMVLANQVMIDYFIQFAKTYLYTSSLPPALADAAINNFSIMQKESWRREKLQHNIIYFKQVANQYNLSFLPSDSAIFVLSVGHERVALQLSEYLSQYNFLSLAIRPPTVPIGQACLRVTLNCMHTQQNIDDLLACIAEFQCQKKI